MREKSFAVFVDGSNFSKALQHAKFTIDYDRVLIHYRNQGTLLFPKYFTALPPKEVVSPLRRLIDRLQYNGWTIVTKETKSLITSEGLLRNKGDMDVEIACHAFEVADRITDLVLFSGDGDFRCLVEFMQWRGVQVTAVSHHSHKDDCIIADELRRQVNTFIDIKKMDEWRMGPFKGLDSGT
jgi:uncharacterized LabA/DUF88 family protein